MRYTIIVLIIIALAYSCSPEKPELIEKDGLMYLNNNNELFTGLWKEVDENGIVFTENNYLNGRKDGKYTIYDSIGNPWYEGYIKNSFEDSLWTEWHQNDTIKEQGMFKEGVKHGCWKRWDKEGSLSDEKFYRTYVKKHESGGLHYKMQDYVYRNPEKWWLIENCNIFHENGKDKVYCSQKFIDYKNVLTENEGKVWHENGQITEAHGKKTTGDTLVYWKGTSNKEYSYGNNWSPEGILTRNDTSYKLNDTTYRFYNWYYENGMTRFSGNSIDYKRHGKWFWGEKNGDTTAIAQYRNDTMLSLETGQPFNGVFKGGSPEDDGQIVEATYKNGIKNGPANHTWRNEAKTNNLLYWEGDYKDGKRDGLWTFYKKGIKANEQDFVEGKLNGKITYFFENGNVDRIIHYKNDKVHGEWVRYRSNGTVYYRGFYINGKETGVSHYFYPSGKPWGTDTIINENEKISVALYESGKLYEIGNLVDNRKNGTWKRWYNNGNPNNERNYLNGNLHGESHIYHENGNIELVFNVWNNILSGSFILYDTNGNKKIEGNWLNGERSGDWLRYNALGNIMKQVEYDQGESHNGDTIKLTFNFQSLFDH